MIAFRLTAVMCLLLVLSACGGSGGAENSDGISKPVIVMPYVFPISKPELVEPEHIEPEHIEKSISPQQEQEIIPDYVVTPIDHTVTQRINNSLPEFTFRFRGETVHTNRWPVSYIQKITITDEYGNLIQEIANLDIFNEHSTGLGSLAFDDWNFDGYLDFTMPHVDFRRLAFFLWDSENNTFVRSEKLEDLSSRTNISANPETERIWVSGGRMDRGWDSFYEYINGELTWVVFTEEGFRWAQANEFEKFAEQENYYVWISFYIRSELIDGEMTVVYTRTKIYEDTLTPRNAG